MNQITLHKQLVWDHLHLSWQDLKVTYKNKKVPLREHVTVQLKDKIRLRNIFDTPFHVMLMVKQGDTWYNMKLNKKARWLHAELFFIVFYSLL